MLYQILEKTPFSIKYYPSKPFQPIAVFQVQMAEFDLKLNKTHYYEQALQVDERFYYPRDIAERIVSYWQKRYPFAEYKLQKRRRTKRAADVRKAGAKVVKSKSKVTVSPARG